MNLSLVQMDAALAGAARRTEIENRIEAAAQSGADLVLFPELAVEGYGSGEAIGQAAMAPADLAASFLQRLADRYSIAIATGLALRAPNGALLNAAALFRPGAEPVTYAKRRLYGAYEHDLFRAGTVAAPLVEWRGIKLGLLICFDVEFPEQVRELALAGADLVLVPTALPASPGAAFIARSLVPTRAFENGIHIAYTDHCGNDALFAYQGLSVIAAPDGSALAQAGTHEPALLSAPIDPAAFTEALAANPYLDLLRGRGREAFEVAEAPSANG